MDVQLNVVDLLAAFAAENATLAQRAVLAEQKVKAYTAALEQEQTLTRQLREQIERPAEVEKIPVLGDEPAVDAVKTPRQRRRS